MYVYIINNANGVTQMTSHPHHKQFVIAMNDGAKINVYSTSIESAARYVEEVGKAASDIAYVSPMEDNDDALTYFPNVSY